MGHGRIVLSSRWIMQNFDKVLHAFGVVGRAGDRMVSSLANRYAITAIQYGKIVMVQAE